jgi:hypothetical protein
MRLRLRLIVPLVICLVAIAISIPSIPTRADCNGPYIELMPGSGVPGTQLTVQGVRFVPDKPIDIYYDGVLLSEGTFISPAGEFSVPFTVPESYKGDHDVVVQVGTVRMETRFYATPGLALSPVRGQEGTTVTVTGHGFVKNEENIQLMYFTDEDTYDTVGQDIEADTNGFWETTFEIPVSGRGEHKLDAEGHFSQTFDVKNASFTVTPGMSIDKSSGIVGESVTVNGARFEVYEKDIRILFNGQPVVTGIKADGEGNWEETFDLPELATGNYTVTVDGQYTAAQDIVPLSFEITPTILLSATTGYVGMNVTVTGYGFIADKTVSLMFDGKQQGTAMTDGQGNFEGSFLVPQSHHGDHEIAIGYSATSTARATFTVESDPPDTPLLSSPSDGTRVGVRSGVTPTFQWSAVSDDSGVNYDFQLSTSSDVTSTGEFADPVVSVSSLAGTTYTLKEGLPLGTYYWIVRAVDGAQNEGGWSTPRSLRVGIMPLWAFIAIIVAVVVLVIFLARALIRRRRYADWW